jgi:hypothetical protein
MPTGKLRVTVRPMLTLQQSIATFQLDHINTSRCYLSIDVTAILALEHKHTLHDIFVAAMPLA